MPYIKTTCKAGKSMNFIIHIDLTRKGGAGKRKRTGLQKHRDKSTGGWPRKNSPD